ncbi:MAG: DUF4404 family protein [Fibrobacterota bacterium]
MEKKNYHESLTRLQAALKGTTFNDHGHKQAALELHDNVKVILEHPGEAPFAHHYRLMGRLQDAVTRFEASHPGLTAAAASVIDALNKMGI